MKVLVLGCGNRRLFADNPGVDEIGLDIIKPADVVWDLNIHPLPFEDQEFDEVHAYHVLEHLGSQGDYRFFCNEWNEYWRILKPNGWFIGIVPMWNKKWAFGDPGHTRVLPPAIFTFLSQDEYVRQVGKTGMADYRKWYHGDFKLHEFRETGDENLYFSLRRL